MWLMLPINISLGTLCIMIHPQSRWDWSTGCSSSFFTRYLPPWWANQYFSSLPFQPLLIWVLQDFYVRVVVLLVSLMCCFSRQPYRWHCVGGREFFDNIKRGGLWYGLGVQPESHYRQHQAFSWKLCTEAFLVALWNSECTVPQQ